MKKSTTILGLIALVMLGFWSEGMERAREASARHDAERVSMGYCPGRCPTCGEHRRPR